MNCSQAQDSGVRVLGFKSWLCHFPLSDLDNQFGIPWFRFFSIGDDIAVPWVETGVVLPQTTLFPGMQYTHSQLPFSQVCPCARVMANE
jgi:hypothetical protein